jgi:hypothetical protein
VSPRASAGDRLVALLGRAPLGRAPQ